MSFGIKRTLAAIAVAVLLAAPMWGVAPASANDDTSTETTSQVASSSSDDQAKADQEAKAQKKADAKKAAEEAKKQAEADAAAAKAKADKAAAEAQAKAAKAAAEESEAPKADETETPPSSSTPTDSGSNAGEEIATEGADAPTAEVPPPSTAEEPTPPAAAKVAAQVESDEPAPEGAWGSLDYTFAPAWAKVTATTISVVVEWDRDGGRYNANVDPGESLDVPIDDTTTYVVVYSVDDEGGKTVLASVDFVVHEVVTDPPTKPSQVVVPGPNNDSVNPPSIPGVEYTCSAWADNAKTCKAEAKNGSVLPEGSTTEWNFTDGNTTVPPTETDPPTKPSQVVVPGPNNDSVNPPSIPGVEYTCSDWADNTKTCKAEAKDGSVLPEGSTTQWTFTDGNTTVLNKVTAVNGTFSDECGPEFNLVFTPAVTEGVKYVQTREGNTVTVTAEVTDSSKFELTNPKWYQTETDKLVKCPVKEAGESSFGYTCEALTVNAPTGVMPEGAEYVYKLDGSPIEIGEHPVMPGEHTLTLEVNGVQVDSDTFMVEACPVNQLVDLTFTKGCGFIKVANPETNPQVTLGYGRFGNIDADGWVTIDPGKTVKIETKRSSLDIMAYATEGDYGILVYENVAIKQKCGGGDSNEPKRPTKVDTDDGFIVSQFNWPAAGAGVAAILAAMVALAYRRREA